ncbi:MAG: AP2/ERF family transcription factor [Rhodocyclaceae bacterium]
MDRRATHNIPDQQTEPDASAPTQTPKPYGIAPYFGAGRKQLGWKVMIRRRGVLFERTFNARDFGGFDGARQAALALRDEIIRDNPLMSKREYCATLRSNNTSGVTGVHRVRDRTGEHWKACVHVPDGRRKTRQFSIAKYGEDGARRLAIEARRKLLALVEGTVSSHHPDVPEPGRDCPAVPYFDKVVRLAADDLRPNPLAPPVACEVIGVHLSHRKIRNSDGTFRSALYWIATMECGTDAQHNRLLTRYFSVLRHGDEEARRLAIEQRRAWEAQQARSEPYTVQRGGASEIKGVTRGRGIWVATICLPNRRTKTRHFAIAKYGEDEARRLAIEQQQAWEAQRARGERCAAPWANESGIRGIVRSGPYWQARVTLPDGRRKTRSFAFARFGEEGALQRAIKAQRELIEAYRADEQDSQTQP